MKSGVYKITNTINSLIYIGSAEDIDNRWGSHRKDLRKEIHKNKYLQRAWNKYGENAFKFEIVELTPNKNKEFRLEREQYWMDEFNSYNHKYGYNLLPKAGSPLGYKMTKPPWNFGIKTGFQSEETCLKKSQAHLGKKMKPFSQSHKDGISLSKLLKFHKPEDIIYETRICKCGCTETFTICKYKKQQYLPYHATRGRKTWNTGLSKETDMRVKLLTDKMIKAKTGVKQLKETQDKKRKTYYLNHPQYVIGDTNGC